MKRIEYNPLNRLSPMELIRIADRLEAVAMDESKPDWLRVLAMRKRVESLSFARIGFLQKNPGLDMREAE